MTADQILTKEFRGSKNVITPDIISIGGVSKNQSWELSSGKFMDTILYGVSIVSYDPKTDTTSRDYELSKCFETKQLALDYIQEIKKATSDEQYMDAIYRCWNKRRY